MSIESISKAVIETCSQKFHQAVEIGKICLCYSVQKVSDFHVYLQTSPRTANVTKIVDELAAQGFELLKKGAEKAAGMGKNGIKIAKDNPKATAFVAVSIISLYAIRRLTATK